ncbi:MAG: class F sortase [Anaerolineales bacterium]|nr:class F sortase [Anaerolineales bacterium]
MRKRLALILVLFASLLAITVAYAAAISVYTVDDGAGQDVGYYTALAIDANGNAMIAYYNRTNQSLEIAICNDNACSSPVIVELDSAVGGQGTFTSIALDANGFPLVSYYALLGTEALRLFRCFDALCSSGINHLVDDPGVGAYTSLAMNSSDNAVISYYDGSNGNLKLARCDNTLCTLNTINTVAGGPNDEGMNSSLKLGAGDLPVIAYYDADDDSVKLARCSATDCSGAVTINTVDDSAHVGFNGISLQLDSSGFPVMSYYDITNSRLKLAHCSDLFCTGAITINVVDDSANVGQYSSMKLDGGLPVISYYDETNGDLKLARCQDVNCASADIIVVDAVGDVGWDTSLQLGSAHISYYDVTNGNLMLAFVPSPDPAPAEAEAQSPQALPQTGFAMGRETVLPQQTAAYAATDFSLVIPALGVDTRIVGVPVSDGAWDVSWLGSQAGHLGGTTWPTWVGNSVITGHVWNSDNSAGVFAGVRNLAYGDQIEVHAGGQTYVYEVRTTRLVSARNLGVLDKNDGYAWLTLITCEGYNPFTQDYIFRRAVSAVLVDVK